MSKEGEFQRRIDAVARVELDRDDRAYVRCMPMLNERDCNVVIWFIRMGEV